MMPGEISSMQKPQEPSSRLRRTALCQREGNRCRNVGQDSISKQSESGRSGRCQVGKFVGLSHGLLWSSPHSICVSLSPSCLLWCLSVSLIVSCYCKFLHPSVCLALLSFSVSLPPLLCLSVSYLFLSLPYFCIALLLCALLCLSSSRLLDTYYILQSV